VSCGRPRSYPPTTIEGLRRHYPENLLLHYGNVTFMLQTVFFVHNRHNSVSSPSVDN